MTNAAWFVRIEGRRLGREAAKRAIRDSGAKLSSFSMKEITMLGEEWFQSHREELMAQAWRTLIRCQLRKAELAQYRRGQISKVMHSKAGPEKSIGSAVQNIGAE
jgi:hypothetical protein